MYPKNYNTSILNRTKLIFTHLCISKFSFTAIPELKIIKIVITIIASIIDIYPYLARASMPYRFSEARFKTTIQSTVDFNF